MTGRIHLHLDRAAATVTLDNADKRNSTAFAMCAELTGAAGALADRCNYPGSNNRRRAERRSQRDEL